MGKPEKCGTAKRGEKMFCIIYIFTAVSYALSSVLFWLVLAITPLQDIRHPLRLLCFPARFFFGSFSLLFWLGLVWFYRLASCRLWDLLMLLSLTNCQVCWPRQLSVMVWLISTEPKRSESSWSGEVDDSEIVKKHSEHFTKKSERSKLYPYKTIRYSLQIVGSFYLKSW